MDGIDYDAHETDAQTRATGAVTAPPGLGPTRVFRASGMREAFARVKAEIGPDAIILGTRDMKRFDADPAERFEVVAAFPGGAAQRGADAWSPQRLGQRPSAEQARPWIAGPGRAAAGGGGEVAGSVSPGPSSERSDARTPAPQALSGHAPPPPRWPGSREVTPPHGEERAELAEQQLGQLQEAMQSLEAQLACVLDANRAMHDELSKLSRARISAEAAAPTSESAALLVAAGVERDVAEHLVSRAVRRVAPRRGVAVARPPDLAEEIHRTLQVARPLWHQPSGTVCAMVGPTGAGKTTTLLKIAALARFAHGRSVACVTTDVDRIGAYEQLALYCEVMGLPLVPAGDRETLDTALDDLAAVDLVLIDTPGHNPFDAVARHHVLKVISAREVQQHLVLSATLATSLIGDTIECYSGPALKSLILTKIDEARGLGALLAAAIASDVPVSHTCDGQDVPDAIHAIDRARITRELLAQAS